MSLSHTELVWVRILCKMAESKMTEFKMKKLQDCCHHQVNQIELVWVGVRVEEEWFWVNLREDNNVFESNMAVSETNMAEFKMAAIIRMSQNEWVKLFFVQNGWIQDGRFQDGCHHQVESEWMSKVFLCKMAEWKMAEFKMVGIIKLSENERVWVRLN